MCVFLSLAEAKWTSLVISTQNYILLSLMDWGQGQGSCSYIQYPQGNTRSQGHFCPGTSEDLSGRALLSPPGLVAPASSGCTLQSALLSLSEGTCVSGCPVLGVLFTMGLPSLCWLCPLPSLPQMPIPELCLLQLSSAISSSFPISSLSTLFLSSHFHFFLSSSNSR